MHLNSLIMPHSPVSKLSSSRVHQLSSQLVIKGLPDKGNLMQICRENENLVECSHVFPITLPVVVWDEASSSDHENSLGGSIWAQDLFPCCVQEILYSCLPKPAEWTVSSNYRKFLNIVLQQCLWWDSVQRHSPRMEEQGEKLVHSSRRKRVYGILTYVVKSLLFYGLLLSFPK